MLKKTLALVVVGTFTVGCVTAGEHDKLKAELSQTQTDLKNTKDQLASTSRQAQSLDSQLKDSEARADDLLREQRSLQDVLAEEKKGREVLRQMLVEAETKLAAGLKDKKKLKASVKEMQQALEELKLRKKQADARIAQFKLLLDRFKSLIDAGKLKVKILDGRMVVELATDVLFSSGSARLSKPGMVAIGEVAGILKDIEGRKFQIEGHSDNVPINSKTYPSNWHLAAARAVTVVREMISAGMPAERLSAASFGEHAPVAVNRTKEGRAANRRIEIVVVPDLSSLPGFEELKAAGAS
jgi:chemotaxis protein MotB